MTVRPSITANNSRSPVVRKGLESGCENSSENYYRNRRLGSYSEIDLNISAMSETPITAVFARDGAMKAEVEATTQSWDEVSDKEWLKWKDMSCVASGINANPARHILTEHGIKFERNSKSKECFTCPCCVSLVGCGSRARSSGHLGRDFLNCTSGY